MLKYEDYEFIDVPDNCISKKLEICPKCNNTKSCGPYDIYKILKDHYYKKYYYFRCDSCKIYWMTTKEIFESKY